VEAQTKRDGMQILRLRLRVKKVPLAEKQTADGGKNGAAHRGERSGPEIK